MVKIRAKNTLLFGLSKVNIERLQEGKPIKFSLKDLGCEDIPIVIFYGETEEEMQKDYMEATGIKIIEDPNGDKN